MFAINRIGSSGVTGALAVLAFLTLDVCRAQEKQIEGASESPAEQPVAVAIDSGLLFERVTIGADGRARFAGAVEGSAAGSGERLIYGNTLGIKAIQFPTNQPVSDDIATTAPNGCALTRYRFKVLGKVLPTGDGGEYTVTYGLYTQCPLATGSTNAQRDLVRIPGTEGVIAFPDDAPRLIEHIVPAEIPVSLPTNVYLSLRFNRGNCGTVVGAPAMIGYSGDVWDFPGFPCNGFLGGFPELPHASFWAEFFGAENCPDAFVAYKTNRQSGGTATPGANIQAVDDITLSVNNCQMVGYEATVRGVGFYTFDLRRECDGSIIAGTERNFSVNAGTAPQLQVARFTFDPPIALTTPAIYLGFKSSSNTGGAVIAGIQPIIGKSSLDYFIIGVEGCAPVLPTQGVHGAVNFAITCAGSMPTGACCDPYLTECAGGEDVGKRCLSNTDCAAPSTCKAVCRQTTELNCSHPPDQNPQWAAAQECGPDAFGGHVCGIAACCYQNEHGLTCDNLTQSECDLKSPVNRDWQFGQYCGEGSQACSYTDYCLGTPGSCFIAHDTPGCNDPFCCGQICWRGSAEKFCCEVAWDSACVALAETYCAGPSIYDQCAPGYPNPYSGGALAIPVPGSRATSNSRATTDATEPGFCCNTGTGVCVGGSNEGASCVVGSDCISGVCTERVTEPWAQAFGTVWFKFVPPAGVTSVGVSTCTSNSPALDSVVQVFAATDLSSQLAACNSLVPIGCNDDTLNCGSTGRNSRLCLRNLTPGNTYYIELAAKTENRLGQYIVTISTSCTGETQPCTNCPAGEMTFVDPPSEVVDARRPHPPTHPEVAEGIQAITASGPIWATKDCWSVCQSPETPSIQIESVKESPPGTYTMHLSRPISPGAVTTLIYTDKDGQQQSGRFIAHPANADANGLASPSDILALVDHLNGVKLLPWGHYSGDLDHSGIVGPADIITLIDLLNGNGYSAWHGTELPQAEGCP